MIISRQPIRRALLSVSDKTGLLPLAQALRTAGVQIISTGGTAQALRDAGIEVSEVSQITGFPEIMDGRVKTLHPKIHGALLARQELDDAISAEYGIEAIDLLVVNLYPFVQTVAKPECTYDEAIEYIDIGGPAMLRAAAKNHARVAVLCDPSDYTPFIDCLAQGGSNAAQRRYWAAKTYAHTSAYDGQITEWLSKRAHNIDAPTLWPSSLHLSFQLHSALRYGENPHQDGALFVEKHAGSGIVATADCIQGKALSFNNIADADAALECVKQFDAPACVIVKHANPCGVAVADTLLNAYQRAFSTDPSAAFGGIIAFNRELDGQTAQCIAEQQFVEVIIAPRIAAEALAVFSKKPNVRILACGVLPGHQSGWDYKRVAGGLLVQNTDSDTLDITDLQVVTETLPSSAQLHDLLFAWKVAMCVKSNAIVFAKQAQTLGIGAGQMSRVISAKIAALKAADAGLNVSGAVMASDAFFPFRDGLDSAAAAGIAAVIQPGGSMRDQEVIAAANAHGIAMVFTGRRHFKH